MSQCSRVNLIALHRSKQHSQVWSAQDNLQLAVLYSSHNSPQLSYATMLLGGLFVSFSIFAFMNYLKLDD